MIGFQRHVAGALNSPFVVLFEEDCTDQPSDGGFVWKDADGVAAALDLAVQTFDRSIGLVECVLARCWAGKPM